MIDARNESSLQPSPWESIKRGRDNDGTGPGKQNRRIFFLEFLGPRHGRSPAREEGSRFVTMRLFSGVFNAPFGAFDQNVRAVIPVGGVQMRRFKLRPGGATGDVVLRV